MVPGLVNKRHKKIIVVLFLIILVVFLVGGFLKYLDYRVKYYHFAAPFANVKIDDDYLMFLPDSYRQESSMLEADNRCAKLVSSENNYRLSFRDYDLSELLDTCSKTTDGVYCRFKNKPKYFLCDWRYTSELSDFILSYIDYEHTPNPVFSVYLTPHFRCCTVHHIGNGTIPRDKLNSFAEIWVKPNPMREVISSYQIYQFRPKDSLIVYRIKESPELAFLFLCEKDYPLYGEITQYPIVMTIRDDYNEAILFETKTGYFCAIETPENVKGQLHLFEWKKGEYIRCIGPQRLESRDYNYLRNLISTAIQEANNYVFKKL